MVTTRILAASLLAASLLTGCAPVAETEDTQGEVTGAITSRSGRASRHLDLTPSHPTHTIPFQCAGSNGCLLNILYDFNDSDADGDSYVNIIDSMGQEGATAHTLERMGDKRPRLISAVIDTTTTGCPAYSTSACDSPFQAGQLYSPENSTTSLWTQEDILAAGNYVITVARGRLLTGSAPVELKLTAEWREYAALGYCDTTADCDYEQMCSNHECVVSAEQ